jgi:anti-anti-sigma regulatory factor/anti-sigma regulatory factor (Ser/Thr protein kinase)
MRVRTRSVAQHSVLVLGGTITAADTATLRRRLTDVLMAATSPVVIADLSRVTSADPQALATLASHHGMETSPGPVVCIAGARGEVARTLDRLGVSGLVPVAASVPAALELARSRPPVLSAVRRFPPSVSTGRLARRFCRDVCAEWGLEPVVEDVELVVDELVANAVEHAGTELVVRLERTTRHVVVSVHDDIGGLFSSWWRGEAAEDADAELVWGHGLTIVRALAETAGVTAEPSGGKVVWAALPAELPSASASHPMRWRLRVNSGRAGHREGRWLVHLDLVVLPERPQLVGLALSSRPRHPSLPRGRWQVSRSALRDGLRGPSRHGDIRMWPEHGGRELVLQLPDDPPRVVRVSASRVRQFLTATAVPGQSGRAATTADTGNGP